MNAQRKSLEVFKGNNGKNTPFQKGPLPYKIDYKVEGDTITGQNQVIKTKTKVFDFKTTQVQVPIFISETGSFGNVGERSYPKSSTHTKPISEQPLPCRKKGWREPPVGKLNSHIESYIRLRICFEFLQHFCKQGCLSQDIN